MWQYNDNELYHYGVKGMKWGVRRTPEQLGYDLKKAKKKTEAASTVVRETQNIRSQTSKIKSNKSRKQARAEASKMTDQELRERVNRLNMEQQYANLSASQVSAGRSRVDSTLNTVGTAIALTNSALAIALAIKQLKG